MNEPVHARSKSRYTDAVKLRVTVTLWILALGLLLTSCASDPDAGKLRVTLIDVGQGRFGTDRCNNGYVQV